MRFLSRAALTAFALLACAFLPAQASARGLDAYDVTFENGQQLEQLARAGLRHDGGSARQQGRDRRHHQAGQAAARAGPEDQAQDDRRLHAAQRTRARSARTAPGTSTARTSTTTYVGHVNDARHRRAQRQTLYEELQALAAAHQDLVKQVDLGTTINGKPILAFKITKNAREIPDGQRPAIALLVHAARARVARRPRRSAGSLHLFVENYGGTGPAVDERGRRARRRDEGRDHPDRQQQRAVVPPRRQPGRLRLHVHARQPPVAQEPARQQRRRPDHARARTASTRTATSRRTGTTTTRARRATSRARPTAARAPAPSPRRRRSTKLLDRVGFEMNVNYHTAAELLLYPIGFQVETYTADDPIYRALSGTDADSAIKGNGAGAPDNYDPDVGAELYTTNGDTNDHLARVLRHPVVDAGARRGGRRARRRRQRLRVPGPRGRRPRRVREEHPVRARRGEVRGRSGQPGVAPGQHAGRTSWSRCSRRPTATRRTCRSTPSASSATSPCTTASTAAPSRPRRPRSGTAASATAAATTSTTTASAAR